MFGDERMSADNSNEEAVRRQDRCKDPKPMDMSPEMSEIEEPDAVGGGRNS